MLIMLCLCYLYILEGTIDVMQHLILNSSKLLIEFFHCVPYLKTFLLFKGVSVD